MRLRYQQRTSPEMSFDINAYSCKLKIQSSSPKPNQEKSCIVTTVNELLSPSFSAASLSTNTVLSSKQSPTICPSSDNNSDASILTFGVDKFTPLNTTAKKVLRTRDNGRLRNKNLLKRLND